MQSPYGKNIIFWAFLLMVATCKTDVDGGSINHLVAKKHSDKHAMVIFVHGTMLPLPSVSGSVHFLRQFFLDEQPSQKSLYQSYLDCLKSHSIYSYQPSGHDGLHPIT